uniref:VWA domain-containing protein n=1 Tax=CrAss-like virus sp. ctRQZ5 TaxID=2826824 RepID=A0A8S5LY36_9CAUD|nr:MAG TPA: vWA domain-containing protein [CrAss-like virus sp. ctRQZ5]DAF01147.1 MAG TPA: vWA domain-containing protein [Caudoviricetes sp.]
MQNKQNYIQSKEDLVRVYPTSKWALVATKSLQSLS